MVDLVCDLLIDTAVIQVALELSAPPRPCLQSARTERAPPAKRTAQTYMPPSGRSGGRSLTRYGTVGFVRMYLSSFRLGNCPKRLVSLARHGKWVAVIANAMDAAPPEVREGSVQLEVIALTGLGFTVDELDLRSYFLDASPLGADLRRYDVVGLRGGNALICVKALPA